MSAAPKPEPTPPPMPPDQVARIAALLRPHRDVLLQRKPPA